MNLNELLKRKSFQVGFCVFSLLLGAYSVYSFVGLFRQTHTRALEREFGAAVERLEKSPPGFERAESFVRTQKDRSRLCARRGQKSFAGLYRGA